MRTLTRIGLGSLVVGLSTVTLWVASPTVASAQSAPPNDGFYYPMPAAPAPPNPYTQPQPQYAQPQYAPPNQYIPPDQYGQTAYGQPGEEEVGYDDAGAEAAAQAQAEYDSGYVDDGYDEEAYQDYEAALSPYGSWVNTADYGQVWEPSSSYVGDDFMPYSSGGHWALTEYGWTWVSDWDWGWAPFHYGRWMQAGNYGWVWRPGRVWGPAWVSWRYGGGYVGWSPLPPRGMSIPAPPAAGGRGAWRFTSVAGLSAKHPSFVNAAQVRGVFAATTPLRNVQSINSYHVEAGPHPQLIAAALGHSVQPVGVHTILAAAPRATIVPRVAPIASYSAPASAMFHAPAVTTAERMPGFRGATPAPAVQPRSVAAYRGVSPSYSAPSYNAPSYHVSPSYNLPSSSYHVSPTYSVPTYRAAPSYRSAPSYNVPAYHETPASEPIYRDNPAREAPAYNSNSAPARETPSYGAPAYHAAPSYSAPAAAHPSYSAPVAPHPSFNSGGRRR